MKKKPDVHSFSFRKRLKVNLLAMKLLAVLLFAGSMALSASTYSQKTKIDLQLQNSSLTDIFSNIERSSDFIFFYDDAIINNALKKSVSAKGENIEKVLGQIFEGTNVAFMIDDRQVFLYKKDDLKSLNPLVAASIAQQQQAKTVSGVVKDQKGDPMPGVTVVVKGTTTGVITDGSGNFTIRIIGNQAILQFSFVGYTTQEVTADPKKALTIVMEETTVSLNEMVVTALGIKKSAKSLGYSTSNINSDQLTVNRTPNLMNSLSGKIAGVSISGLGTGPAGTSKIRIRGQSSISGQNSPLIVVNGVPIDNTNFGTNPGNAASDNSIGVRGGGNTSDGGDGLSSINPDDIESMTVLKGAAASALYGSRAKDGVIMITTKTQGTHKGLGITYNMNYSNDTPLDFTDYQYVYGQGEYGVRPTTPNPTSGQWSFGEKFQPGMTQVLFNNITLPYAPQKGIINQFFRHGQNMTNTVSVSTSGEKGGLNLSLASMTSDGIVPNNTFKRNTLNLGFSYKLSEKLSFQGNMNYSFEDNENPPNIANQDNSIPTAIYAMANSMPLDVLKANAHDAFGNEYVYSRFKNRTNPYFTLSDQFQHIRRDRMFGNISAKYDIFKWLFVQGRLGQDFWSRDQSFNNFPTGQASLAPAPAGFVNGVFTQEARRFRETNADFLITVTKEFGDFGVNASLGGNQMKRRSDLNSVQVTDFVVRNLYTVQNGRSKDPLYDLNERAVNSLYSSAEISYKHFLYLNGTVRNDWFSTLSPANRSILYPSVSASYIFSETMGKKPTWLTFGKIRAAFAEVGSDTDVPPYSNLLFYGVNSNLFANPAGSLQPVGGASGSTVPNPNLRPMRTSETELGLEMKMFDNRLGIDLSVYRKITTDQIVQAQISDASGFIDTRINSGKSQNKGIEMMVNVVPFRTKNFQWDFTFAGAYNITKVLSLLTDKSGERITVGTHVFNGELRQIVGEEMGQIAGFGYKRDASGQQIFGSNGIALRTTDLINFGSALPKWTGGITNSFNYKGVMFSFLIDFKLGNKMLSGTNFNAYRHGLHKATLEGRESGMVGKGVDASGNVNTAVANVQDYWSVVRSLALVEPVVYNGGYWKLRQLTLGYDFSKFLPSRFMVKGLTLNLTANNVLMLKKWVDNIDPESFGYSSDNLIGMESPGLPTTRSLGFNLNVKF